jgi:NitT/TauT family transport system substrate-binding protein
MVGYVFDEAWAARNRSALERFLDATRKAKDILANSDAEWQRIAPLIGTADAKTLAIYRNRYREGIPRRPVADEEADARRLYRTLAQLGGAELVRPAPDLASGTFYRTQAGH